MMKKVMKIDGMTCAHCEKRVMNTLSDIEGVENVVVNLGDHSASFEADERVTDEILKEAIDDADYDVVEIS